MLSCDISMAIRLIQNINYDDAILMSGISNTLYTTSYANRNMYIAKGRGIMLIDELLDKLNINYKELTLDEVYELSSENYNNVLVITPLQVVDNFEKVKPNVVQFFNTYATFQLIDIQNKDIILELASDLKEIYKRLNYDQLKIIKSLKVKPLDINIKFIFVENNSIFNRDHIKIQLRKMIDEFITPKEVKEVNGGWWEGPLFYDKLKECISTWNEEEVKVIKFILYQSILDGSSFFYRKEFSQSLNLLTIESTSVKNKINYAAKQWRTLGRHLKNHLETGKKIDTLYLSNLIDDIKENEITAFNMLKKELNRLEGNH